MQHAAAPFRDEDEFVRWLQRRWPQRARSVSLGIGDDAAVVRPARGSELVLTTDLSVEGVHFRRDLHPPRSVGHRALARALSDLAAMGARPRFALVSLALPRGVGRAWLSGLYEGLTSLAKRCGAALIGGDTGAAAGGLVMDVVAAGEVRAGSALRREGARPGDRLWVTGRLGLAALGLAALEAWGRPARHAGLPHARRNGDVRAALRAHLYPEPRLRVGAYLASRRLASAAIDVSDGFARDLARLCAASGCAAVAREESLPLPHADRALLEAAVPSRGRKTHGGISDRLELALRGGEDYELIFTAPANRKLPRSIAGVPISEIGEIRRGRGLKLLRLDGREEPLWPLGYDHFRVEK